MKTKNEVLVPIAFYVVLILSAIFVLLFEFVIPHGGVSVPEPIIVANNIDLEELLYPGKVPTVLKSGTVIGSYYTDSELITVYKIRFYDSDIFVADVVVRDSQSIVSAFSYDIFGGKNYIQKVSTMAKENDAIFAINADNASHFNSGYVIRNGFILRTSESNRDSFVLNYDGSVANYSEKDVSIQTILSNGAWQSWSFGPLLIDDGVLVATKEGALEREIIRNPRTAIGAVGDNHFMFVVVDGRSDISEGVDIEQLAYVMRSLTCAYAYNFDGGSSSAMWFDGEIINNPSNKSERAVGDSVFISK